MTATIWVAAAAALQLVTCDAIDSAFYPIFHVRPEKNWINDPNGPMYYNGVYHLFMQYNPWAAVWGNMSWHHSSSADLVHWTNLPYILTNNDTYDNGGVFSGSVTIINTSQPSRPVISYTCVGPTGELQCQAYPPDLSDPLLKDMWVKDARNPLIAQPPPNGTGDFRDDTTAWWDSGRQVWVMAVGARLHSADASVVLYTSADFNAWTYSNVLFTDPGAGMDECPDFYQVTDSLWALKYSRSGDWVTVGTYDSAGRTFTPLAPRASRLYDYGQAYASKSFWDEPNSRRVLWIWVAEESGDAESEGWQGMQSLPRVLAYDPELGVVTNSPLPELTQLRTGMVGALPGTALQPGDAYPVPGAEAAGNRVEIDAYFLLPPLSAVPSNATLSMGLLVLAQPFGAVQTRVEVGFKGSEGPLNNTDAPGGDYMDYPLDPSKGDAVNAANCSATCASDARCAAWTYVRNSPDPPYTPTRCSLKSSAPATTPNACCISGIKGGAYVAVNRSATGGAGPAGSQGGPLVLPAAANTQGTTVRMHVYVDGSIIEAFINGGSAVVTSRVYPVASDAGAVGVYAGEGNTLPVQLLNATVWTMGSIWVSEDEVLATRERKLLASATLADKQ